MDFKSWKGFRNYLAQHFLKCPVGIMDKKEFISKQASFFYNNFIEIEMLN